MSRKSLHRQYFEPMHNSAAVVAVSCTGASEADGPEQEQLEGRNLVSSESIFNDGPEYGTVNILLLRIMIRLVVVTNTSNTFKSLYIMVLQGHCAGLMRWLNLRDLH